MLQALEVVRQADFDGELFGERFGHLGGDLGALEREVDVALLMIHDFHLLFT